MLSMVKQPIAFNPTKELFKTAQQNGWEIVIERKNMIYKLEVKNGSYVLA
jgi:phosphoserine phosphatase